MIHEMSTNELAELLKQKPEINFMVDYYREILKSVDDTVKAIEHTVKHGYNKETLYVFWVFPVRRVKQMSKYEKAKLITEKLELKNELFTKSEFFERWLKRSKEYDERFEMITNECNMFYDWMLKQAEICANANIRLRSQMESYFKNKHEENQRLKNEFYLYIKREVENRFDHMKRKFIIGGVGLEELEPKNKKTTNPES